MSCQVSFPLQDIVLLLREKISPEIIGAVPEEKLEEEVLLFIQPKIDELQEQLTKLPPEVHVVTQVLQGSLLKTTLNNGKVLTSDLSPLFTKFTKTLEDFGAVSGQDSSAAIQAAFDWSAQNGGALIKGKQGSTYIIDVANYPAEGNIFKLNGSINFDGQLCTFKIKNGFGDYHALIARQSGDVRIKNLIIDENTLNNPLTLAQSNEKNFRSAMFLWGAKDNNVCEVENITFKDWCGIWQITTNNFSSGYIKNCKAFASIANVTWIDRTSMYVGIHGAEVSGNKFYGNGNDIATTVIESHASGQIIKDNYAIGYRNSMYLVNDPLDDLSSSYQDVVVRDNKFINTTKGVCFWNTFAGRDIKNIKVLNNTVRLNSHLSASKFIYPVQFGIGTLYGGWENTKLEDIKIKDNDVEFIFNAEDVANDSTVSHGIQLNNFLDGKGYYARNIEIKNNTVKGAFHSGIILDFIAGNLANSYLQSIDIEGNKIIDCGVIENNSYAIKFLNAKNLKSVNIKNNLALDTRQVPRMHYTMVGLFMDAESGSIVSGNNELRFLSANSDVNIFNYYKNNNVLQINDKFKVDNGSQDHPTHYAMQGSTVIDTRHGITWHQVAVGTDNKWVVKANSDSKNLGVFATAGSEITPLDVNSPIAKWVNVRDGYAYKDWTANTQYAVGDIVSSNGQTFRATQSGTSGTTSLTWSATPLNDGSVVWEMMPSVSAIWEPQYKKLKQVTLSDSVATDVETLKADFNTLLAQLK